MRCQHSDRQSRGVVDIVRDRHPCKEGLTSRLLDSSYKTLRQVTSWMLIYRQPKRILVSTANTGEAHGLLHQNSHLLPEWFSYNKFFSYFQMVGGAACCRKEKAMFKNHTPLILVNLHILRTSESVLSKLKSNGGPFTGSSGSTATISAEDMVALQMTTVCLGMKGPLSFTSSRTIPRVPVQLLPARHRAIRTHLFNAFIFC